MKSTRGSRIIRFGLVVLIVSCCPDIPTPTAPDMACQPNPQTCTCYVCDTFIQCPNVLCEGATTYGECFRANQSDITGICRWNR